MDHGPGISIAESFGQSSFGFLDLLSHRVFMMFPDFCRPPPSRSSPFPVLWPHRWGSPYPHAPASGNYLTGSGDTISAFQAQLLCLWGYPLPDGSFCHRHGVLPEASYSGSHRAFWQGLPINSWSVDRTTITSIAVASCRGVFLREAD